MSEKGKLTKNLCFRKCSDLIKVRNDLVLTEILRTIILKNRQYIYENDNNLQKPF